LPTEGDAALADCGFVTVLKVVDGVSRPGNPAIAAGDDRGAARAAGGGGDEGPIEAQALAGELVEPRGLDAAIAVGAEIVGRDVIGEPGIQPAGCGGPRAFQIKLYPAGRALAWRDEEADIVGSERADCGGV
jgi:hypothetical protein